MPQDFLATLQDAIAHLPRPSDVHAPKPKIKDLEGAELACLEIAWCHEVQAAIKEAAAKAVKEITEAAASALWYEENGELVPIKKRRESLEDAVMKWADDRRAELCPGRKKSVALRHAEIKWRDGKDAVDRLKDVEAKDVKEKVAELMIGDNHESAELVVDGEATDLKELPLAGCLRRVLDLFGYFGAIASTPDVNKSAAVTAYKDKQLTDAKLEAIDHEFKKGEEYITILPAKYLREGV